jgi:hypothetical protein
MNDELTDLLDGSAPPVSRDAAIEAEAVRLARAVVASDDASRSRRRTRLVLGGAALAVAAGTGTAVAGSVVSDLWGDTADVKVLTDPEGVRCELVFLVGEGNPTGATEAAELREARRVANQVLSEFEYSPAAVAEELARNPDAYRPVEPPLTSASDEVRAQLHLADQAVQQELASRGLPHVGVASESVCGEALDR